jgi:hypothetical protein
MRLIRFAPFGFIATSAFAQTPQGSATPSAPAREPEAATAVTIAVPKQVAGFEFVARHDYDDQSLGVQLRYANADSVMVDVFVYPGPDLAQHCAQACAAQQLDTELADFRGSIPEMIKRGYVQAMTVVREENLAPPAGAAWRLGHHMRLAVKRDDRPMRSEFYLFYLPRYRVKIRSTFSDSSPRVQSVEGFASGLVPAMVGAAQRPAADERNAISMSVKLSNRPSQVFLLAARALRDLGFTIADSSSSTGELNTSPSYAWPAGSEKEKWHGTESPGVVLHVVARASGTDSTFFGVTALAPVRSVAGGDSAATTLRLLSTVTLMGRVTELLEEKPVEKKP